MARPARAGAPVTLDRMSQEMLGSFFAAQAGARQMDAEFDAMYAELDVPEVPFTIGRGKREEVRSSFPGSAMGHGK